MIPSYIFWICIFISIYALYRFVHRLIKLLGNRMEDSGSRSIHLPSDGSSTTAILVESSNSASWVSDVYRRVTRKTTCNQDNMEPSQESSRQTRKTPNNGRPDSQSSRRNYTRSWRSRGNSSRQPDSFTGDQVSHSGASQSRTNCREAQNGSSRQNRPRQQTPPQYTILQRDRNAALPPTQASKNEWTLPANPGDNTTRKERDEVPQDRLSTKRKDRRQQRNRQDRGQKANTSNSQAQSAVTQEKQLDGASSTDSSSINNGIEEARCSDAPDRSHSDTTTQQNQSTLTEKRLAVCKTNKPPFRNARLKTSDHPEEKKEPSSQESNTFEENLTLQNTHPVKESDPSTKPLRRSDSLKGKKDSNTERTVSQNPASPKKPFKWNDHSKSNDKKELSTSGDLTSQNSSSVQKNDPITKPLKQSDPSESKSESKKLENSTASNPPLVKKSVPIINSEEFPTLQANSVNKPRSRHKEAMQFYQPPALRRQESLQENEPSTNNSTGEVSQSTQKSSHSVKSDPIPVENRDKEFDTKLESKTNNVDCKKPVSIYPKCTENWDLEVDTKLVNNANNLHCNQHSKKSARTYPTSTENWDLEVDTKLVNNANNLHCNQHSKKSVSTYPKCAENWDLEIDTKLEHNTNLQTTEHISIHNMGAGFVQKQDREADNVDCDTKPSRKNKSKRYSQGRRRDHRHSKEEPRNDEASFSSETAAAKFDTHTNVPQQTKPCNSIKSEEAMHSFDGKRKQNFGRRRRNDSSEPAVSETQNQRVNVAGHSGHEISVVHKEMINKFVKSLEDDQVNEQFSSSLQNVRLPDRLYNSSSMVKVSFPEVSHIEAQERQKINEWFSSSLQNTERLYDSYSSMYPAVSNIDTQECRKDNEQFNSNLQNVEHSERLQDNNMYSGVSHFEARESFKVCTPPPGFTPAPQKTNTAKDPSPGFPSVSKRREHGNFSEPPPGFPKVPKCTETDAIHKTDQSSTEQSYYHPECSTNMNYHASERNLDPQVKTSDQNDVTALVTRPVESDGTMKDVKSKECIDYWDLRVETVAEPVNKNSLAFQIVASQDDSQDEEEDFDYWDFSGTRKVNNRAAKSTSVQKQTDNAPSEMAFLTEVNGDLFSAPNTSSLVHCVAEDLRMSSGIAVDFRQKFGRLPELLNQRCKTGELAVLPDPKDSPVRYICYLVTKPKSTDKPTIQTLESSLQCLREHCDLRNVTQLAMPRIGCGLDLLKWSQVTELLHKIFGNSGISITIYSLDKAKDDMEDQSIKYFSIKESLDCCLSEKESGTARVFLASEVPMADSTMQDLNVKYRFLSTYETAKRSKGSMFRYECKFPHEVLYGLVVRGRSIYEPVDFLALDTALRALRKDIKKDDYSYIGIEAFYEENDPMIVEKLVTAIKWVFAKTNVQLHVCWPKTVMMQYGITSN